MSTNDAWLLPEGIEELLPPQAERLERLRRELIDQLHSWGYELVVPPIIDYLESLLTGTGNDLKLQTFTLTDQISGRQMGSILIGALKLPLPSAPPCSRVDTSVASDCAPSTAKNPFCWS